MDQKTDQELITLVKQRDALAFEVLYDRYARSVMGLVYKIIQNDEIAAEIVQETFIRIWDRCDKFDSSKGKFAGWMFGIARNLSIDKYRRLKIRPEAAQNQAEVLQMELAPSGSSAVDEKVNKQLWREKVRTVLNELNDDQREIIELAYFQGFTHREIAHNTGIALGTVNSRARRALLKLGTIIKADPQIQGAIEA